MTGVSLNSRDPSKGLVSFALGLPVQVDLRSGAVTQLPAVPGALATSQHRCFPLLRSCLQLSTCWLTVRSVWMPAAEPEGRKGAVAPAPHLQTALAMHDRQGQLVLVAQRGSLAVLHGATLSYLDIIRVRLWLLEGSGCRARTWAACELA